MKMLKSKGGFFRSTAILFCGTALAQAIVMVSMPAISRLYSPEDIGCFGVYFAIASILSIVASGRYELAIPLATSRNHVVGLTCLAFTLLTIVAVLLTLLSFVIGTRDFESLGCTPLTTRFWLIPIGVALTGSISILVHVRLRLLAYVRISSSRISQSATNAIASIILYPLGFLGLVLARLTSDVMSLLPLVLPYHNRDFGCSGERSSTLVDVAMKYRKFPTFSTASAGVNAVGQHAPSVIIAMLFGPAVTGQFVLVQRLITMPVSLVGAAVSQVFLSRGTELATDTRFGLKRFYMQASCYLLALAVVPSIAIVSLSNWLIPIFLGADWQLAGEFGQYLGWVVLSQFVAFPLSQTSTILGRQEVQLAWDFLRLLSFVVIFFVAKQSELSPTQVVACYAIASSVLYATLWVTQLVLISRAPSLSDSIKDSPETRG